MITAQIKKSISQSLNKLEIPEQEIQLDTSTDFSFGDYSTNCALQIFSSVKTHSLFKNSRELADQIVRIMRKDADLAEEIELIEVAGPGFINFFLSKKALVTTIAIILKNTFSVPKFQLGTNGKIMIEYAHPNTHKPFHIGHLLNITLGESLSRLLEAVGNTVIRANYEGDVGLHIAKCLWGLQKLIPENAQDLPLSERIDLLGKAYVAGNSAYEDDGEAKEAIKQINSDVYIQESKMFALWQQTRKWSLEYFDRIYRRVDTRFDRLFFESEVYRRGLQIADEAVAKGVLEKSEGAIVFRGEKYRLHTRVFVTKEGNPTYEGKDLGLAELETSEFGKLDKIIHVVDIQQSSYFSVLFKVLELLDHERYSAIQQHFAYGFVTLKEGRMSSRKGTVILGEWLLDTAKQKIQEKYPDITDEVAEKIAIGAVKYSFLKTDPKAGMSFDFEQSISLEGNSGPYLQYTYARIQSILRKSGIDDSYSDVSAIETDLTVNENTLLRMIYRYQDILVQAASQMKPDILATYLYDTAKLFNSFYQHDQILSAQKPHKEFRLALVQTTAFILKHGLNILAIPVIDSM